MCYNIVMMQSPKSHENHEEFNGQGLLFGGLTADPDGHTKPMSPTYPTRQPEPISTSLASRSRDLTEALDYLAVASRNRGLLDAATEQPYASDLSKRYGGDQNVVNMLTGAGNNIDRYTDVAKGYFARALGLGAMVSAGVEIKKGSSLDVRTQAGQELNRQWRKFLEEFSGPANHDRLNKYRKGLRVTYKSVTGEKMPPTSLQIKRASEKTRREAKKANSALHKRVA